jgi:hypothetical protein
MALVGLRAMLQLFQQHQTIYSTTACWQCSQLVSTDFLINQSLQLTVTNKNEYLLPSVQQKAEMPHDTTHVAKSVQTPACPQGISWQTVQNVPSFL